MCNKGGLALDNDKVKLCPYLPVTEERKAVCIGTGDITVTYFNSCLKEKCMAYVNGECSKLTK